MRLLMLIAAVVCISCTNITRAENKAKKDKDTLERVGKKDREEFRKIKLVVDTSK